MKVLSSKLLSGVILGCLLIIQCLFSAGPQVVTIGDLGLSTRIFVLLSNSDEVSNIYSFSTKDIDSKLESEKGVQI